MGEADETTTGTIRNATAMISPKSPLVRLLAAILIIQGIFWLVVHPNFIAPAQRSFDVIETSSARLAQPATVDLEALEEADFQPLQPGSSFYLPGYFAVRANFALHSVPETGLALIDFSASDNHRHYVNGKALPRFGSMAIDAPSYYSLRTEVIQVPPSYLQTGENRFTSIKVIGSPAREASFSPPLLGEYTSVKAAVSWALFLRSDFLLISVVIGFTLSLFLLVVALRARERDLPLWLFLLTFSWSLLNLFWRWFEFPLHGEARVTFYSVTLLFMSACWPLLIDTWTQRSKRWFRWLIFAIFLIASAASIVLIWMVTGDRGWLRTEELLDTVGLAFMVATLIRLVWHFVSVRDEQRYWEAALFVLLATLLGAYLYNLMLYDQNLPYLRMGQPIILLAFATMFFSRNYQLFRSTEQINTLLKVQLDEKTSALATAHEREKGLVRQKAHDEERRRLMRDMHDGLGSHLMSMLVMARRGRADHTDYADGLQQVIDEMRLMINSLDSVGDSLPKALDSFRKSVTPRIATAGYVLEWEEHVSEGQWPELDARTILQIFRILQEAVTNAVKHSGGDVIRVSSTSPRDGSGGLVLKVTDNGEGFDPMFHGPGGRGLGNMRARAASIGAEIDWQVGDGGTCVVLTLSNPQEAM